jgi:hypothetical protein
MSVVKSQVMPVGQFEFIRHSTQRLEVVSQTGGPPPPRVQSPLVRQSTHRIVAVLQTPPGPLMQSAVVMHVGMHMFVVVSQNPFVPQSVLVRHSTHLCEDGWQTPPGPAVQSPFTRHWTHNIAAVSQIG